MVDISIDGLQRAALSVVVAARRGAPADLRVIGKVHKAITFSEDERKALRYQEWPDQGRAAWDPKIDIREFPLRVALEDEHARKLLQIIETHQGWAITDADWLEPLMHALEAANN